MTSEGPLTVHHFIAPARLGGMESVVAELCVGLGDRGHRVRVSPVLSGDEDETHPFVARLEEAGAEVIPVHVGPRAYRTEWMRVRDILAQKRPDVVHTHGFRPDLLEGLVARRMDLPLVTTVHGFTGAGWRTRVYRHLQRWAFRSFDGVVVVSAPLERELRRAGVPGERLHLIRNARPVPAPFRPGDEARADLRVDPEMFHVGWVGRLSPEKGPDIFVRAMAQLPDDTFVGSMVGDGPLWPELPDLARELGLNGSVRWHGELPDARGLMRAFDVVVLSSRTEGTPVVLLEAVDAGVPVIATRVGGIPDVVSESEATLVPPERPDLLAEAILDAYRRPDAARARAERALERMADEGSRARWLDRYEQAYTDALVRHRRNGDAA